MCPNIDIPLFFIFQKKKKIFDKNLHWIFDKQFMIQAENYQYNK